MSILAATYCQINNIPSGWYQADCPWWRHQMETFSALLAIGAGNSPVPGEFPTQRPVTRSIDVYFDLRPNKRLSKQSRGWWFETPSRPFWRHRNAMVHQQILVENMLYIYMPNVLWSRYHLIAWNGSLAFARKMVILYPLPYIKKFYIMKHGISNILHWGFKFVEHIVIQCGINQF